MTPRDRAILRAAHVDAPEDANVERLCEAVGYGAVMDAAARLWARKDPNGALYIAGECLRCEDLEREAQTIRKREIDRLVDEGQEADTAKEAAPEPVWDTLLKYYTEPEALRWLTEPHPQLDDQAAAVLLAQGNPDPVWRILERLEADGYL